MNKIDLKRLAGYRQDLALWSAEQAALIREGKLDRVDLENVAEEIESLGRSEESEIENRMAVLLAHLLKHQFQPDKRSPSWTSTIFEQRYRIARVIRRSPSLKAYPATTLDGEYLIARRNAAAETGMPIEALPETCPYTIDQALDPDYLPGQS
ncbi:DUF29 domain-containing protein [Devosia sp. ZB163]|uniref:DUF29 domain-containing protein n=1 Tax=Devosia sp. ZB163 TaxID=3025938 RepID=UPI0023614305|nr:DUF29 domain-containing protein [Devosia sp. ZB163]MDC9825874.1 DUF29 domain-containing protein [Devosia sp. ZB163]